MANWMLGRFELALDQSGKLNQLRIGRKIDLLHEGGHRLDLGDGRVFRVGGWDECFPSILACADSRLMGELIETGSTLREEQGRVVQTWETSRFVACRSFGLGPDGELAMGFRTQNRLDRPLPFLWASHALFATAQLACVSLPDGTTRDDLRPNGSVAKVFVSSGADVALRYAEGVVTLRTDQPLWGIWVNRGGWPQDNPAHFSCLGIEATNTASDLPSGALLRPGEVFEGHVWVKWHEKIR